MRSVHNGHINFGNVKIPHSAFLPEAKSFRKGVESMLRSSRLMVNFITYGVCMGVYRNAAIYAASRQQFSKPISSFQLVQEKLVRIMANVQAVGLLCWRGATLASTGESTTGIVAMIKAFGTERGR